MTMPFRRPIVTLGVLAGLLAATLAPATAQQGHNPFPATPVAGGAGSGWEVVEVTPLELEGAAIAISPDGSAIAGVGPEGEFCAWSVPDLEPTCAEADLAIDPDSIAWAPDSTAVAFSVRAFQFGTDGDIYVFETASGEIVNVTDDGLEDASLFSSEEPIPIDVMPAWMPDSQALVFSRTIFDDREEYSNEIMRVRRTGGEAATLLSLPGLPGAIFLPMHVLEDGSVLYSVGFSDQSEPLNGLWRLPPGEDPVQLMPGTESDPFPIPMINDVWEGNGEFRIVGHSPFLAGQLDLTTPFTFTWSSATGEAVPLTPASDAEPTVTWPGAWAPDGETLLTLERPVGQQPLVGFQGAVASTAELPETGAEPGPGRPRFVSATWSSANTVLIPPLLTNGAYLLTVAPVPGS